MSDTDKRYFVVQADIFYRGETLMISLYVTNDGSASEPQRPIVFVADRKAALWVHDPKALQNTRALAEAELKEILPDKPVEGEPDVTLDVHIKPLWAL